MIDLGQVRSFVMVATELNFSRAARRLNMTQPPLSRQIQLLEQFLDVRLLERTSRRVVLTPAGMAFLAEARRLIEQSEASVIAARRAARVSSGSLTLAFVGAASYDFLPRMVAKARTDAPHIELSMHQMETTEQVRAINSGYIDLGFSRPLFDQQRLASLSVAREPLMLAIPQSHPLASRRRTPLELIDGEPFITFAPQARYLHEKLEALLSARGIKPRIVQQMTHSQAILSLVSAGIGLALVPQETRNACFDNVVFRPIDPAAGLFAELHAIWSPDNRSTLLPEFRDLIASLQRG